MIILENGKRITDELQDMLNFIGASIDTGCPMPGDDLNELWQWLSDILGELE